MKAVASVDLITELDAAVSGSTPARRAEMLRQLMHLLALSAHRLREEQIGIFDDVLVRLLPGLEPQALLQLSTGLSGLAVAPKETVRRLADHEQAPIAAPLLRRSQSICDHDLGEIAGRRGRQHLLAISERPYLDETLTDVLLRRGDIDVCRVLAKNAGARLSQHGFAKLVAITSCNEDVAESLGFRPDIPPAMLRELLSKTTDAVRIQLLRTAPPRQRQQIRAALDSVAAHVGAEMPEPIVYSEARAVVLALSNSGKLNDSTVNRFAVRREHTKLVAALALLSGASIETIERLMEEGGCESLVVACRASRLNWLTTLAVINNRNVPQLPEQALDRVKKQFDALYLSTAQRLIRFGSTNNSATTSPELRKALAMPETA
ncbi:DUF2336 domain-containing protein [Bradyrhizobium sp.]|uniref:DUF2336 domain-containing protein n=1 Tax=Bradyrhizobium sp. TaxID=376 RepID=UPI003C3C80DD